MKSIIIIFSILLCLFIWSIFIEPNILTVKKYKIEDPALSGFKIVFVSDFHYKTYEKRRLIRDIKKINQQNADIVLLGGDYVSGHEQGSSLKPSEIAKEFGKIKSKYGTFAVLGNHDGWQGAEEIKRELENNKIVVLKNSNTKIELSSHSGKNKISDFGAGKTTNSHLFIAGLEDLQTGNPDIQKTLKNTENPTILLSHSPDIINEIPNSINILLSGHLHGGQIRIPGKGALITPSKYGTRYAQGFFTVKGIKMLVTKGIGTSILPVRFNCFPEIVVIEF